VDERERRMEWGAEEGRDYSGWLTVADRGEGGSEVVVHLSFGERSAGPEIEERSPEGRDPWRRESRRRWRASAGRWRRVRASWRPRRPRRAQNLS
jgi:hypothetical protein